MPSLQAPGFITAVNSDRKRWNDVSSCTGIKITAKSDTKYDGFRVSFGSAHPRGGKFFAVCSALHRTLRILLQSLPQMSNLRSSPNTVCACSFCLQYGYKANFMPSVGSIGSVKVPFRNFTDFWDDATGDPIHTCDENEKYCPDEKTLTNMKTMSIWAEGVEGDIRLEITAISGFGCATGAA